MDTPNPQELLAGAYELRPGRPASVGGQRPVLGAGRLSAILRGRRGEAVGDTLTGLFTLCAHAHRRLADMALAAAGHGVPDAVAPDLLSLLETARDHLRSIALDWPQRLAGQDTMPNLGWLRGCPLKLAGAAVTDASQARRMLAELGEWLARDILLEPPGTWLARHRQPAVLAAWCGDEAVRLPPANCLAAWHPLADRLRPAGRCLDILDGDAGRQRADLQVLAAQIAGADGFVQQPTWAGAPAENGPWARRRHLADGAHLTSSVWTRLTSRWLELVEIAAWGRREPLARRSPLLVSGALALAPGEALAWCEMARGLLFHWVRLDGQGVVRDYRVLAPTEWNFHPAGTLAAAVAQLDASDTATARALAAAFDPCVACSVVAAA